MVVDADALNILSHDPALLKHAAGPRLLTPHPGEMERLFPRAGRTRRVWLEDFVGEYPVTLLLKGARTVVGTAEGPRYFNTTGHPGMASGGMGDVLTGIVAGWLGHLLDAEVACKLGVFLHGAAGDLAAADEGQIALTASDVASRLGDAMLDLGGRARRDASD